MQKQTLPITGGLLLALAAPGLAPAAVPEMPRPDIFLDQLPVDETITFSSNTGTIYVGTNT